MFFKRIFIIVLVIYKICIFFLSYCTNLYSIGDNESRYRDGTPLRISVFTPTTVGNTYWPEVHKVMQATAADLGVKITFHEFGIIDRFEKSETGSKILQTDPTPDGAIFSVAYGQALMLMNTAESHDIPFFLNGPLFPSEKSFIGNYPRKKYQYWIGYFQENEEMKGYLLARELMSAAIEKNLFAEDGLLYVAGITGDKTWHGSYLRELGLRRAIDEEPKAVLSQTVPTKWTQSEGKEMTFRLLKRYPEISVIWAASDQLALGAAEALLCLNLEPGDDVFIGGLDLSLVGLEAVKNEVLFATVGCSPVIWSQILIYLFDYLNGLDYADKDETKISFFPEIANRSSVDQMFKIREQYTNINFRDYSRFFMGVKAKKLR